MIFHNRYFRFLFQALKAIITIPFQWLGYLVPVSKAVWVFGHTFGYKDNPKYVYEYLVNHPEYHIRPIWITKDRQFASALGESYYYLSLKGLFYQYRAAAALIATGKNDVASFTLANKKVVQLWHGIPIKKLLLDSPEITPFPVHWTFANRIYNFFLKRTLNQYAFVAAVNVHNRDCLSKAFGLPKDKVIITGMPRHDVILEAAENDNRQEIRRILYAPTWHSSLTEAQGMLSNVLSDELISYCRAAGIAIDVSIHPLNAQLANTIPDDGIINLLNCSDINAELCKYDLLITDYSSIALDYSILGRPVIFSCDNIEKYRKERGIYDFFLSLIQGQNVKGKALVEKIASLKQDLPGNRNIYDLAPACNARMKTIEEVLKIL